jgi:hypothetical protein
MILLFGFTRLLTARVRVKNRIRVKFNVSVRVR